MREEQLDRLARDASKAVRDVSDQAEGVAAPPVEQLRVRLRRRRQRRAVAAVAVVAVVTSGVAVSLIQGGPLPVPVIGQPDETTPEGRDPRAGDAAATCPSAEPDVVNVEVAGWEQLAPPPAPRARAATVWVEGRLLVIGGDSNLGATLHDDVFAYDPTTGSWGCLAPAPFVSSRGETAVAEGQVFLLGQRRAAAYDVDADVWRQLPNPPTSGIPVVAVWTGDRLLIWGSRTRGSANRDGALYDPETGRWEPIAKAPLGINVGEGVWTGRELIVAGAEQDHNNRATTDTAQALAYDPTADRWRHLPDTGLSPQHVAAAWNGRQVIAADEQHRAIVYDPDTGTWDRLNDVPVSWVGGLTATTSDDGRVLMWDGAHGALLDPTQHTWTAIDTPATARPDTADMLGVFGHPVTADGSILFAGAAHEGHANRLWRYTPPN